MAREWRKIPGFGGKYLISEYGEVYSVARWTNHRVQQKKWKKGKYIAQNTWGDPAKSSGSWYYGVTLVVPGEERGRRFNVHRLVALTFLPNPQEFSSINHLDGDTHNNHCTNLEWCEQAHNVKHQYKTGRRPTGKDHHFAKMERDSNGRVRST